MQTILYPQLPTLSASACFGSSPAPLVPAAAAFFEDVCILPVLGLGCSARLLTQGLPCCGRADFPLWKPRAHLVPLTGVRWSVSRTVVPAVYSPRALPSWPLTLASGLVNFPFPGPFQATQHPPSPFCHQSLYHSCSHPDLLSCSVLLYYFFPSFSFPKLCVWVPLMQS